jgi:hypothetical protein
MMKFEELEEFKKDLKKLIEEIPKSQGGSRNGQEGFEYNAI